jgi:hypothetical protein
VATLGIVQEPVTAERRTLITEVLATEPPWLLLYLDRPLLLEAGQRYWVDAQTETVIVEDTEGHRQSFPGHQGDPAERLR